MNVYRSLALSFALTTMVNAAVIRNTTVRTHLLGSLDLPSFDTFDLNGDGTDEFLVGSLVRQGPTAVSLVRAPVTTEFFREVQNNIPSQFVALPIGSILGPDSANVSQSFLPLSVNGRVLTSRPSGEPDDGELVGLTAALGFRFEDEGNTHYGYVLITNATGEGLTVLETAWEDQPDSPIMVIPEPSTMLLSLTGLMTIIRKRTRTKIVPQYS